MMHERVRGNVERERVARARAGCLSPSCACVLSACQGVCVCFLHAKLEDVGMFVYVDVCVVMCKCVVMCVSEVPPVARGVSE